jgi:alpha-glucuronidase
MVYLSCQFFWPKISLNIKFQKLKIFKTTFFFFLSIILFQLKADDGYRLWLKYDLIKNHSKLAEYKQFTNFIKSNIPKSGIITTAEKELKIGLNGLIGRKNISSNSNLGGILFEKDQSQPIDGFKIKNIGKNIIISAGNDAGILYGCFELLRQIQIGNQLNNININSSPKIGLRMLNHWDNVMGTIERGYAGSSLWKWYELPETIDQRYTDYARANASIGINAVSVNNVNASARFLTAEYIPKVKALADVFRPYGIKVFLSLNFASPKILGKLKTSDPLDPAVRKFWADKTNEIYAQIPDFGGFLVKANSEGEPGPQEYGRNHADGANMLAEAIKPFGGLVIWRAFVYSPNPNGDRFKEAFNEFTPLDGQFADNVIVQVKNGPIDFMPREPFHPLFGAMPKTQLAMEFQITQEYLGQSTNLVFLPTMFKECLESDTYANGKGTTVAKIVSSKIGKVTSAMVGVANTGSDRNWTGHLMSQANWYGFGRLAWNYEISAEQIADEWIKMTLAIDPTTVQIIKNMLLTSRETYVDFTYPLGLAHMMGQGIHFGPEPWLEKSQRPDWTSIYYHRADTVGLGFNRTTTGSNALGLYKTEVQNQWNNPNTCDLKYLLWFHHVAWNQPLTTGRSLWGELCYKYYTGVEKVEKLQAYWEKVKPNVDAAIFADVKGRLARQHQEALNWRDSAVLYFQTYSKMPIPSPFIPPIRTLDDMKEIVRIYQLK